MTKQLRTNQLEAINNVVNNNFKSGIIYQATGTGKSILAFEIIKEYNNRNLNDTIFWICEHKFILMELFNKNSDFLQYIGKNLKILNYTEKKPSDWVQQVNNCDKGAFVIINRSFLVSQKRYEKLINYPKLIIHDECHSIKNKTTQEFYNFLLQENYSFNAIGLSATPEKYIFPFDNIIHTYNLLDACIDNIIVRPKIYWFKKETPITFEEIIQECKPLIENLSYKKIVVWCGLIEHAYKLANIWKQYFSNYLVAIDTSRQLNSDEFSLFDEFKERENNAILFCAGKHREGSDIKNLDGCIFLDKVSQRNPKTFIQCLGRVLRMQENKKYGLIIDVKAKSAYDLVKRLSVYINNNNDFPYSYKYNYNEKGNIKINELFIDGLDNNSEMENLEEKFDKENIKRRFKRELPNEPLYIERYEYEINLICEKNLLSYIIFAIEILEITSDIPHITRGSCGSSLVCYLLGISNIDPIKYNIKFERFLNSFRNNLPDIDFDFPHELRDDIFFRLEKKWPGKIARISNHVHFHEKSAKRVALNTLGYKKFIGKYEIDDFIRGLNTDERMQLENMVKNLENTFRMYSLHCGGIIFYPEGVPELLKLTSKSTKVINQITLNKYDIAADKKFKIDILSSRGLTQLLYNNKNLKSIDFAEIQVDPNVMSIFKTGNNIGITLAESPLCRKAMTKLKPDTIEDLALLLAVIRPAARDNRDLDKRDYNGIVYDDDAIDIIGKIMNVSNSEADRYRRAYIKNDNTIVEEMFSKLNEIDTQILKDKIKNLHGYSFCKAHAFSYAQLIYKLAHDKYYREKEFWISSLKNSESSYKKWVHLYEARRAGVTDNDIRMINDKSIYSESRKNDYAGLSEMEQMKKYGVWNMNFANFINGMYAYQRNGVYYFRGLIASMKVRTNGKGRVVIAYLGVSSGKYIEVVIKGFRNFTPKAIGIMGSGQINESTITSVSAKYFKYF